MGEYLVDLNAKQATIRAGYSAKTAEWIGPQLLGKTHVSAEIQRAIAEDDSVFRLWVRRFRSWFALVWFAVVVRGKGGGEMPPPLGWV